MPGTNIFVEKRAHPRFKFKIPVKYRVIEGQKETNAEPERKIKLQTSQTMDVSLGGVYIIMVQPLNIGSILRVEITLPGISQEISAFSEVVWTNNIGGDFALNP